MKGDGREIRCSCFFCFVFLPNFAGRNGTLDHRLPMQMLFCLHPLQLASRSSLPQTPLCASMEVTVNFIHTEKDCQPSLISKHSPTESKDIPELVTVPFFKDKHGQCNGGTGMSCYGCCESRKNLYAVFSFICLQLSQN